MILQRYTQYNDLKESRIFEAFQASSQEHPNGSFFQSAAFFQFIETTKDYQPILLLVLEDQTVVGSILGVIQTTGNGLKSWLSRRMIVWGGPLISTDNPSHAHKVTIQLLQELKKYAASRAIFVEFRNSYDTSGLQQAFEQQGFAFKPHLNYIVTTDEEAAVKKRMSSSRLRQIKSSLKAGAIIVEASSEAEIFDFYDILAKLYREKVKKPLPQIDMFLQFWQFNIGKFFIIKYQEKVIGGIMCPIFANKVIYEWYVCGEDGMEKGLHPSVLATWAPIEYALHNGFQYFDFMGAGKPEEDYGVREFKARFGGEEVAYGRYHMVLNKSLYKIGKLGLKAYQQIK